MMGRWRAGYVLIGVFLLQASVSIYWLHADRRPWIWDMALHARLGLSFLAWVRHPSLLGLGSVYAEAMQYPPLYYIFEAFGYALFGRASDVAAVPNFFLLALMLWSLYRIGTTIADSAAGLWAALLTAFFPIMIWISRVPLLDFALTAWVCWCFYLLLKTDSFNKPRQSVLFGLACGLGMLIKWTLAIFLAGPALALLAGGGLTGRSLRRRNFLNAVALALGIASVWYLPRGTYLVTDYFPRHLADGVAEGDPGILSPKAWLFYLEFLVSYQLFMPLAILAAVGILWSVRWSSFFPLLRLVWIWMAGSWFLLTLLRNKDPRYSVPLLPALALLAAVGISRSGRREAVVRWTVLVVAAVQFVVISFPIPRVPDRFSLGTFHRGTYTWDWQIFSKTYAGFLGPPQKHAWPLEAVLADVRSAGGRRLFVIPDHPYFSAENLLLAARLRGEGVVVESLRALSYSALSGDFFVSKSGDQGDLKTTEWALSIASTVEKDPRLRFIRSYPLPDGSSAYLYGKR